MPYFVSQLPDACATVVRRLFVICLTSVSQLSGNNKHGTKDTKNNGIKACCICFFALSLQDMQILNQLRVSVPWDVGKHLPCREGAWVQPLSLMLGQSKSWRRTVWSSAKVIMCRGMPGSTMWKLERDWPGSKWANLPLFWRRSKDCPNK